MSKGGVAQIPRELAFRVSSRTTSLLGREHISSPVVAVLELVKNAYDADAGNVIVKFRKASTIEGSIEIRDDGHGMNLADIENYWMVIGVEQKKRNPYSPKGRVRVGEKGIGRFALDRLATKSIIETTPEYAPEENQYRLTIDWNKYDESSKDLQEITHPISTSSRSKEPGTRIHLTSLRDRWTTRQYESLYQNLTILVPPFRSRPSGFRIKFDCDEAQHLSGFIKSPMAEAALFRLRASLREDGITTISIYSREGSPKGNYQYFRRYNRKWNDLFDIPPQEDYLPKCGPLEFEFYWYLREGPALRGTDVSLARLREFLDIYGGVRIYRDGFRLKPYGDPGHAGDWLGLSARREKNPAGVRSKRHPRWVVGENQVVASIFISREKNPTLIDQTNREGLLENDGFRDMSNFALKSIEIFETDRKHYEMERAALEEETVEDAIQDTREELDSRVDDLLDLVDHYPDSSEKQRLAHTLEEFRDSQGRRLDSLQSLYDMEEAETMNERRLYQNLATVGIAVSSLGHEIIDVTRKILRATHSLITRYAGSGEKLRNKDIDLLRQLDRDAKLMYSISQFALSHVDRDKRHRRQVDPDDLIQKLYDKTLGDLCATYEARIEFTAGKVPKIFAFPYEIESIIMNLVTNSLAAFIRGRTLTDNRRIRIRTDCFGEPQLMQISVADTGPGISDDDIPRIFGLYSTKLDKEGRPIGTGLGLKIVKEIVQDQGGTIEVKGKGSLGGAEFVVTLPVPKPRGAKAREEGNGR